MLHLIGFKSWLLKTPDWYFYLHITHTISPLGARQLWLSLSCLSQTGVVLLVHFSSAPSENVIHSPSSQRRVLSPARCSFYLNHLSELGSIMLLPDDGSTTYTTALSKWWTCSQKQCFATLPSHQSCWSVRKTKFSILLTGNHYDGSTLDRKLLTANHCVLFYLILIEKQLTSSPKLSPDSFPPHQWNISTVAFRDWFYSKLAAMLYYHHMKLLWHMC